MGRDQHNIGMHTYNDAYFPWPKSLPVVFKEKRTICPRCGKSDFHICQSGKRIACNKCGRVLGIKKEMNLYHFESEDNDYLKKAVIYQNNLWKENGEKHYCHVCRTMLTTDYYCTKCQMWRR